MIAQESTHELDDFAGSLLFLMNRLDFLVDKRIERLFCMKICSLLIRFKLSIQVSKAFCEQKNKVFWQSHYY